MGTYIKMVRAELVLRPVEESSVQHLRWRPIAIASNSLCSYLCPSCLIVSFSFSFLVSFPHLADEGC
jgi:hypothetical protein